MNPLHSLAEYERFVYTFPQYYPTVRRSTLTVVRRGATIAVLQGEIELPQGMRMVVREKLSFVQLPGEIKGYGYEVWHGDELLYWYDAQPHPGDPSLASTHPHHKHVPPDVRHHRIPAPDLSFTRPNLPFLVEEIERNLQRDKDQEQVLREPIE